MLYGHTVFDDCAGIINARKEKSQGTVIPWRFPPQSDVVRGLLVSEDSNANTMLMDRVFEGGVFCEAVGRKASKMSAYYHLKPSGTQHMFNLKGGNGEVVLTSERYTTKQSAHEGIESVKINSAHDERYERRMD